MTKEERNEYQKKWRAKNPDYCKNWARKKIKSLSNKELIKTNGERIIQIIINNGLMNTLII